MAIKNIMRAAGRTFLLLILLGGGVAGIWYSAQKLPTGEVPLAGSYLLLGLVALAFLLFGILVATFFSVDSRLEAIGKKLEEIRNFLAERARETPTGKEGFPSHIPAIESLERQIRQLRTQMESWQKVSSRLETTLELFRHEAEGSRAGLRVSQAQGTERPAGSPPVQAAPEADSAWPPASTAPKAKEKPVGAAQEDPNSPAWIKTLDNILEDIDEGGEK